MSDKQRIFQKYCANHTNDSKNHESYVAHEKDREKVADLFQHRSSVRRPVALLSFVKNGKKI